MKTETRQSFWRERLRSEFTANGLGVALDVASKRIAELEDALEHAEEVARQAVNIYEETK